MAAIQIRHSTAAGAVRNPFTHGDNGIPRGARGATPGADRNPQPIAPARSASWDDATGYPNHNDSATATDGAVSGPKRTTSISTASTIVTSGLAAESESTNNMNELEKILLGFAKAVAVAAPAVAPIFIHSQRGILIFNASDALTSAAVAEFTPAPPAVPAVTAAA